MKKLYHVSTVGKVLIEYPDWMEALINFVFQRVHLKIITEKEFKGSKISRVIFDEFVVKEKNAKTR